MGIDLLLFHNVNQIDKPLKSEKILWIWMEMFDGFNMKQCYLKPH